MTGYVLGLLTWPAVGAAGLALLWLADKANRRPEPINRTPLPRPAAPSAQARPIGSANHPAGRAKRVGCPDTITVRKDGTLKEVWL